MVNKYFYLIPVIFILTSCKLNNGNETNLGKKYNHLNLYSKYEKDYKNQVLHDNVSGDLVKLDSSIVNTVNIIVFYEDGFLTIGEMKGDKEVGEWFLYDKRNRLRKYVKYGLDSNIVLVIRDFDKRGQLLSYDYNTAPF